MDKQMDGNAYNEQGSYSLSAEASKKASLKLSRAARLVPNESKISNNCGYMFYVSQKWDQAIHRYTISTLLDPYNKTPYWGWLGALGMKGMYIEAASVCEKAIKYNPDEVDMLCEWGHFLKLMKKYDEAHLKYQKASEIDPNNADIYLEWGIMLRDAGKTKEAIELYGKASLIFPTCKEILNDWGVTLYQQQNYDEAMEKYRESIQIDPDYHNPYFNLGLIFYHQGAENAAINMFLDGMRVIKGGKSKDFIAAIEKAIEKSENEIPGMVLEKHANHKKVKIKGMKLMIRLLEENDTKQEKQFH